MMTSGVKSEKLAIHHMRNPGERMPVGSVRVRECPNHAFQSHPVLYHFVLRHIFGIVEIDEVETRDAPINGYSSKRQRETNQSALLFAVAKIHPGSLVKPHSRCN